MACKDHSTFESSQGVSDPSINKVHVMAQKVVLITGANSGIGRASALYFAKQGWKVAATMRNVASGSDLGAIPNIRVYQLDVTNKETVSTAFESVIREMGAIDAVVNNAGYGLVGVFEAIAEEALHRQMDTNVLGLMRVTRHAVEHMRARRQGVIIQISSVGGRITFPLYAPYHATKWAVEGFTESLHFELEQFNIRMKLVEPGIIKTDFAGRSLEMYTSTTTSDYDTYVKTFAAASEKAIKDAVSPQIVAEMIYTAATDGKKKLRYPVGNPAPVMIRLRRLLSDSAFFTVIKKAYGL